MKNSLCVAGLAVLPLFASPAVAQTRCTVFDPSPTPLNVRTGPYGRIIGTLENGRIVYILDRSIDRQGKPWVYVADFDTDAPIGWVYREYITCR